MGLFDSPFGQMQPTKITYVDGKPSSLHLRRVQLTMSPGQATQRELIFDQDIITLGAMDDNDVPLHDETVSRRHCRIVQEGDHYMLIDQGSTNGTFINGVRIREAYLSPGAVIGIGNTQVRFMPYNEHLPVLPSEAERFGDIVGRSLKMREIFGILEKISPTSATVVIEGETGTGKEVVARTVHKMSSRADGPFIVFDCGAVPESLIESELFGHEKGSFTGAIMTRKGLFEMAQGGTIFLDELGELALDLQPKLLRVLEQREVRRVGSNKPIPINVRVVAATNRSLEDEVRAGRFREDLFYRLSVVRLFLPSLRERSEDIPLLVRHLLNTMRFNRIDGDDTKLRVKEITPEALSALMRYGWPGNVRELVNVIERACSLAETDYIRLSDLPDYIVGDAPAPPPLTAPVGAVSGGGAGEGLGWTHVPSKMALREMPFKEAKEEWISSFERDYILDLIQRHGGNISQAAREADIDRKYFRKLMDKYGIEGADSD
jgi:DNA-binding NtrC family response regulator